MNARQPNKVAKEEALRASELRYRRLFESAQDGILILDAETGKVVDVNPFLIKLLGYSREMFLGKEIWELGFFKDIAANADKFAELKAKDYVRYEDLPLETADGRKIDVEFVSNVYLVNQQRVIQCNIRDITARKQAELAASTSERFAQATVDALSSHLAVLDATGTIIAVNRAWRIFAEANPPLSSNVNAGVNYLAVCDAAQGPDAAEASAAAAGIRAVISGAQNEFELEYPCHSPETKRWFVCRVHRLSGSGATRVVVAHENITARKQAEAVLAEERNLLRALIDQTPDAIFVRDMANHFVLANEPMARFMAVANPADLLGKGDADFYPAEQAARFAAEDCEVFAGRSQLNQEEEVLLPNGARSTMLITKVPLKDAQGNVTALIGVGRDITERKWTENALRRSELEFRAMFETASIGMAQADPRTGKWLRVNHKMCAITGYSSDELLTMRIEELTHPADRQQDSKLFQQVVRGEVPDYRMEKRYLRKDGSVAWVNVNMTVIRDAAGQPTRTMATIEDITTREQAAEAQSRLATAVEQAAEAIVITDIEGAIIYTNPAFEKITGYPRQEVYGHIWHFLQSGKHTPAFFQEMWATLRAGHVWSGHLINTRKDGTLYEEEATISPVLDAAGTIINFVAVKRDVTREVALESQNRQNAKMEAVGQLAGGVAHDFNNKLQIIMGYAEMMLRDLPPGHPSLPDVVDIQDAASRSADLTRQLLAFSRQQAISPVLLDLNAALAGSLKMVSRLIGENIRLCFVPQPDLARVFMDPSQLDQILVNLAVNARDAITGAGSITLAACNRTLTGNECADQTGFAAPGDYVSLSLSDDGAGMTPEIQAHIFEPFYTTKEKGKGTGLGLATVYGIVEQNKGTISVHSVPGAGTTFTILLPRSSAAALAAEEAAKERMPIGTETILVAEDDSHILHQIERMLKQQGYKVLTTDSPRLALEVCAHHPEPIHLLLSDVIMPEMNGKDLAEQIRKLRPGLRVLFMSGYSAAIMKQHGHMPAGLQVLQKPFSATALAKHVRAALDAPAPQPPTSDDRT